MASELMLSQKMQIPRQRDDEGEYAAHQRVPAEPLQARGISEQRLPGLIYAGLTHEARGEPQREVIPREPGPAVLHKVNPALPEHDERHDHDERDDDPIEYMPA